MRKIIGVRFRTAGKVYFFDPKELFIKKGDHVIVETARGLEYGTVVSGIQELEDDKINQPLKPVLRIASAYDERQQADNLEKEKAAFKICLEKIQKHGLKMKLVDTEYTFDNNKILFYFTADGRIDFRELVKDLASIFKTRIELRQIGVRDETKISGVCGRLMCCLKNEEETYEELNRKLPNVGDHVTTPDGKRGDVHSVNVLRQLVKVVVDNGDEKDIVEYHVEDLRFKRHHRKEKVDVNDAELKALEKLERQEGQSKLDDD